MITLCGRHDGFNGAVGVRLVLRSTEAGRPDAAAQELDTLIAALGSEGEWD
ncbi:MAG: hypothetical protein V3S40_06010 [Kiloniellales bacterium]